MCRMFMAFIVAITFFSKIAFAATYYVDSGRTNDLGAGNSWGTAKKTIEAGITLMSKGDTLRIKSGTYTSGISVNGKDGTAWTIGNYYYACSDDGNGNYGDVEVSGNIGIGGSFTAFSPTVLFVAGSNYWWFDGIDILPSNSNKSGVFVSKNTGWTGSDPKGMGIKLTNCTINGAATNALIAIWSMNDVIITDCSLNCADCRSESNDGAMIRIISKNNDDGSSACDGVTFQNNEVQGTYSNEYGALWLKSTKNTDVSGNYFHNLRGSHVCYRFGAGGNHRVYNNVHELGGSNYVSSEAFHVYWFRAFTTGGDGVSSVHDGHIYNNTIYTGTNSMGSDWGIFRMEDDVQDCIIQNNLIIGNQPDGTNSVLYVGNDCEEGSSYMANNTFRNNVLTGSTRSYGWYRNQASCEDWTIYDNIDAVGTSFLYLSEGRPFPYYGLNQSRDGTSNSPTPTIDFVGTPRGSQPDVGAFESWAEIPPNPPKELKIK